MKVYLENSIFVNFGHFMSCSLKRRTKSSKNYINQFTENVFNI